jgi:hypothetical protein
VIDSPDPYQSALDLPSVTEMLVQIRSGKVLTRFIARHVRPDLIRIEKSIKDLAAVVDEFYALFGGRHWIFHDHLDVERIRAIARLEVDQAELELIGLYKEPETLERLVRMLYRFPQLRARAHLLELARNDFQTGRYYATVLVLLAVMDGFVNDVEGEHRGLHTRAADELHAWDSVVGHHLGLTNAHRTFARSFSKTSDEEIHELYRNGIMHGNLLNFDNEVVATKAWNRLFAVADWATSRQKQSMPKDPEPTFRELAGRIRENEEVKRALAAWRPRVIREEDEGFIHEPLRALADDYLQAWRERNYGKMAGSLASLAKKGSLARTAGLVREEYEEFDLAEFSIHRLDFQAAATCEVEVALVLDGESRRAQMRWIRESADGEVAFPNQAGEWRLMVWGPLAMLHRAETADPVDE